MAYPLFKDENDAFLDCHTDRYLYKVSRVANKDNESIAASLAYIYTLSIEVKDLISLTEGVRYALTESELKKYLVHTI